MSDPTASSRKPRPLAARLKSTSNRRDFFARSTAALGGTVALGGSPGQATANQLGPVGDTLPARVPAVHAIGSDVLKIGVIGCGARGKGAVIEAIQTASQPSGIIAGGRAVSATSGAVKLVAMADAFAHQLQTAFRTINGRYADSVDLGSRRFVGLEGWRGVLASDTDLVILATPPAFRPLHFEAAIAAGKHVFMESPVAVDMPGLRRIAEAGRVAQQRGLAVCVGLQRRHEARTAECVARLHDGIIGDLIDARTYTNTVPRPIPADWSAPLELDFQLRHWASYPWASGDFVDERYFHSLDCVNWVLDQTPQSAQGFGGICGCSGREAEVDVGAMDASGWASLNHQLIELTYANDFRAVCQCRHARSGNRQTGEHFRGTAGSCDLTRALIRDHGGKVVWQSEAKEIPGKGWQRQFNELVENLRAGKRPNETDRAVDATTTAILGRMAVRSGQPVHWHQALSSQESLADVDTLFGVPA